MRARESVLLEMASALLLVKIFQNLRVSSAPALTTVSPPGDATICNTLSSCPLRRPVHVSSNEEGSHDQTASSLVGFPCAERISLCCGAHISPLTCAPVSRELLSSPVQAFQTQIVLSAEPPPVARVLESHGHQLSAYKESKY